MPIIGALCIDRMIMRTLTFLLIFISISISINFSSDTFRFDLPANDFNIDASQCGDGSIPLICNDTGSGQYYSGEHDGVSVTHIYTSPRSYQRVKLTTNKEGFDLGTYSWRVFIPNLPSDDAISIGMFIYSYSHNDDKHELDFECGYGLSVDRIKVSASLESEAICYLTSQGYPKSHKLIKIKTNEWYVFSLILNDNQEAKWLLNGIEEYALFLEYGSEVKFKPYISVEHLSFMGKNYPPNSGLNVAFDYVYYSSDKLSKLPIDLKIQ